MKSLLRFTVAITVLTTMTACAAAATVAYTSEADYLNALATLGLPTVSEGFEDDTAWGAVRTTIVDGNHTAPSVTHLGITWTSNNAVSQVTTGSGPARTGQWGFFTLPHGDFANGIGDGWRMTSATPMFAAGGWIETNTPFAKVHFLVDGAETIDFNDLTIGTAHQFLGVINVDGFGTIEVREVEGVAEDQKFIFADDFTFAVPEPASWSLAALALGVLPWVRRARSAGR